MQILYFESGVSTLNRLIVLNVWYIILLIYLSNFNLEFNVQTLCKLNCEMNLFGVFVLGHSMIDNDYVEPVINCGTGNQNYH